MSSNISFSGLVGGLNTNALVQNLLRFDQQRISKLQSTVTADQTQQTAFNGVQSSLQSLQTDANLLAQSEGGVFSARTVTSTDTDVVTAAAGSGAQPGISSLQVLSLATANQVASQGYSDPTSAITQGTFQIQAGTQTATITIDSTNNTLSGLASAISNAGIGVSAAVVDTGSSDPRTQPYRLLLTSGSAGTANAIKITNNLGASASGAVQPNFSTSVIGPAVTTSSSTGTSTVTSAGSYTGAANDTFTFTVASGGTVGTDSGITVNYSNVSGTKTGTLTLNSTDANVLQSVADGVQVNFGTGTLNSGDQFTINTFSPTVQAASNAKVQLGSGPGAIVVQSATNTLTNVIPGVTLSLQSAAPGQTIQLAVSNDVASATTAITNFVNDYNSFASNLATQTAYTPGAGTASGTAGPLNGYTPLLNIQSQIEQQILGTVPGVSSQSNSLGSLGITVDANGQLKLNTAQLQSALTGGVSGVGFDDVKKLFTLDGDASLSGIQFVTGGPTTQPSGATPYTVHITQAATQAAVSGSTALGVSTVIDSTNNSFSFNINGNSSGTVTLASGTYTPATLATEVQSEINASLAKIGGSVTVSLDNSNQLVIASSSYGSSSTLDGLSGSALSALGYTGSEASTGTDVAGSFVVNGVTETANGVGQTLTGDSSNANTAGLVILASVTPSQIPAGGLDSSLTVTQGLAATLKNTLQGVLDPVNGEFTVIGNQISKQITSAQADVTTQTTAMNSQQTALLAQFAALQTVMANLQQTSNLLTAALSDASGGSSSSSSSSTTSSVASTIPDFGSATINSSSG